MLWQTHYSSGKESLWSIHYRQLPSREQFCQWEGLFMPPPPVSWCPFDHILFWYFGEYFSCTLPDGCLSDSIINKDTLLHQSYSVLRDFSMMLILTFLVYQYYFTSTLHIVVLTYSLYVLTQQYMTRSKLQMCWILARTAELLFENAFTFSIIKGEKKGSFLLLFLL